MTRDETKKALSEIACLFPRFAVEGEDKTLKVDLWTEALGGKGYAEVHEAIIRYAKNDKNGFPPSAGQLLGLLDDDEEEDTSKWNRF